MPGDVTHLVLHLRTSRAKARSAAAAEALTLLGDLGASAPAGGALAEGGGVFWIDLPATALEAAQARLPRLGYTIAVERLGPPVAGTRTRLPVRWRHHYYSLTRLYEEEPETARQSAPDRRKFLLETHGGHVREVAGYRGAGGPLSKRALAVCDARLLVNLVFTPEPGAILLDPFAGAGGIVREARAGGWQVISLDCDPALRFGLAHLATLHCAADARNLPLANECLEAVATEPPFDRQVEALLPTALSEMWRVLKPRGRLALLCAAWQAEVFRPHASALGLRCILDCPIDRKGLGCVVLAWEKHGAGKTE